jgi:hypothetical protein
MNRIIIIKFPIKGKGVEGMKRVLTIMLYPFVMVLEALSGASFGGISVIVSGS